MTCVRAREITGHALASHMRLFGTDGVRGLVDLGAVEDPVLAFITERRITPSLLVRLASGMLSWMAERGVESPLIVVGHDDRPNQHALIHAVTVVAKMAGATCRVLGPCTTPHLVQTGLGMGASAMWMLTASHNPATDSGLKWFDADGRKSSPAMERFVESCLNVDVRGVFGTEGSVDLLGAETDSARSDAVISSVGRLAAWLGIDVPAADHAPFYVDAANGAAGLGISDALALMGHDVTRVDGTGMINDGCGAAGLEPGQHWTWPDLSKESHLLLVYLASLSEADRPASGIPIAAALDGDGDRCILLETTKTGVCVVDGDRIATEVMAASSPRRWRSALTIEGDLAIAAERSELGVDEDSLEVAVGDRWLGQALVGDGLAQSADWIGSEDSGHLVMPWPHPVEANRWVPLGDGAGTLIAALLARSALSTSGRATRAESAGWKHRISIRGVDRNLWSPDSDLADALERILIDGLTELNSSVDLERVMVDGEAALLMLRGSWAGIPTSVGVRPSGTEAKISVTCRMARHPPHDASQIIEAMGDALEHALQ